MEVNEHERLSKFTQIKVKKHDIIAVLHLGHLHLILQ